jgi:hypothetical protein
VTLRGRPLASFEDDQQMALQASPIFLSPPRRRIRRTHDLHKFIIKFSLLQDPGGGPGGGSLGFFQAPGHGLHQGPGPMLSHGPGQGFLTGPGHALPGHGLLHGPGHGVHLESAGGGYEYFPHSPQASGRAEINLQKMLTEMS